MKVFLSWSGERSKAVAEALKSWLPQVIQSVEPWISSGIDKGRNWTVELNSELGAVPVGIVCLTRDNLNRPWLLFEAGALSTKANTWTFLFDISAADVQPPLGQFQHTENEKEDVRKLVHSIAGVARKAGEKVPEIGVLNDIFETLWPKLANRFQAIAPIRADAVPAGPVRTDREILEEILEGVRRGERRDNGTVGVAPPTRPPARRDLIPSVRFIKVRIRADSGEQKAQFHAALSGKVYITGVEHTDTSEWTSVRFLRRVRPGNAFDVVQSVAQSTGVAVTGISFDEALFGSGR